MVGREDYDEDLGFRKWKAEAKEPGDSKPRPRSRKLAFIGRTGVGKSAAIDAMLGAPVLSDRVQHRTDVNRGLDANPPSYLSFLMLVLCRACASVRTEIIYQDLVPPSAWRASVEFIGVAWRRVSYP